MLKWLENKQNCPLCRVVLSPSKLICIKLGDKENTELKDKKEDKSKNLTKEKDRKSVG